MKKIIFITIGALTIISFAFNFLGCTTIIANPYKNTFPPDSSFTVHISMGLMPVGGNVSIGFQMINSDTLQAFLNRRFTISSGVTWWFVDPISGDTIK